MVLEQEKYQKAFEHYQNLEAITEKKENILFARLRMMRAAFHQEDYDKVIFRCGEDYKVEARKEKLMSDL